MLVESFDGARVEQIGVVLVPELEARRLVDRDQRQLELGGARIDRYPRDFEAGQPQTVLAGIVQHERHLQPRGLAGPAFDRERLHHLLEGQLLMGQGVERHLLHPLEEFAESQLAREPGAERHRIGKEADERLQVRTMTLGDRGPHDQVVLRRVTVQQDLEGGEQRHKQRGLFLAAELPQGLAERRGQATKQRATR